MPVFAQAKPQAAANAAPAHVADARQDLQGIWSFATLTPLQRPKEYVGRDRLTPEEKAKLEDQAVRDQFVDRPPPTGNPGTYNRFWVDSGTKVVATGRTSLIVDPPDGRMPPLTSHGMERQADLDAKAKIAAGPEDLTAWDRCILGFNAGPPMIGGGYNAYVQLVQTSDYVVVHTEMVHDARIVPLYGRPSLPSHFRQWRGISSGRWDGDTLVVETRNFRSEGTGTLSLRGLGLSGDENLHLTERFRRLDADTLLYEYTIDDPTIWTRPWTVSMTLDKSDQPMYEYACHEGNYGMRGILSGARAEEKFATEAKPSGAR
ncbi:MAG: hypothetical protein M3T56_12585 [Chloroflexota bacterium]|nr:hypothetical protein [Chloroflexota bacterium]